MRSFYKVWLLTPEFGRFDEQPDDVPVLPPKPLQDFLTGEICLLPG